jgi:eukaryotic-like serine/threonine-protein kinase
MDAELEQRTENDAGGIESIALEALASQPIAQTQSDECLQTELPGLNEDFDVISEPLAADGERIDQHCDSRRLNVRRRIELFIQVCNSVHSVHQHAVIHRNLKPGNILITPDGTPRLVDFGKEKSAHGRFNDDAEGEDIASLTRTGEPVLACEYRSPEQVTGEPVTTASDIYALGVILYELMTGRRPYHLKTGRLSEVVHAICEQVPEKPSASVIRTPDPPEQLNRILTGDLDAIISMAMRKEPERRYASANQFAEDLIHYSKSLPVRAYQGSAEYRTIKFIRRHVAAVVISGVAVLALIAGGVRFTAELITARRERNQAEESFRHARETLNQLFTRAHDERLLNQPELHPLRKALLGDLKQFYEDFLNRHSGDRSLRAELASARTHVAQISTITGSTADAIKKFERAVALWSDLVATEPANPGYRQALARALDEQGVLVMGIETQRDEALRIFRRASDLLEPLVADTRSIPAEHELGVVLQHIAKAEHERGHEQEAIENIERSLAIESKLAALDSGAIDSLISMAKGHTLLGQIFVAQPDGAEPAIAEHRQAVELLEKVSRAHPELSDQAFELAMLLGDLSSLEQVAGKLDSALASISRATEILEQLERQHPGVLNYEHSLASTYNATSDLHRYRREPADAILFAQKAKTLLESLRTLHPEDVSLRIDLAKSQNSLGRMLEQTGEPVEALKSFQRAIDLYESIPVLDARNYYNLAANVAMCIPLIGVKNGTVNTIDNSRLSKGDQLRRKRYGDRAVELLRRAVEGGFLDLDILRSDIDLDPIRDRPDFQALADEVEKKMPVRTD